MESEFDSDDDINFVSDMDDEDSDIDMEGAEDIDDGEEGGEPEAGEGNVEEEEKLEGKVVSADCCCMILIQIFMWFQKNGIIFCVK